MAFLQVHPQSADEAGVDWVVVADTLNFSFWQPEDGPQYTVTYKGKTSRKGCDQYKHFV